MNAAVETIRAYMSRRRYDAVILKTRANFAWVTGGGDNHIVNASELGVADIVVLPDQVICVTSKVEHQRMMDEEFSGEDVRFVISDWFANPYEELEVELRGKRIGLDVQHPMGEWIPDDLARLRSQLTDAQLAQMRAVCKIAGAAIEQSARQIERGMTEFEIESILTAAVVRHGCRTVVTLVGTDERIFKYRHPVPTGKRLETYAMLVLGCERDGLIASATRFVHFGALSDELVTVRDKCAWIDATMHAATRPGKCVSDVIQSALNAYAAVGRPDDYRFLHQGGPAGYATREYFASLASQDVIKAGQVYAWNPSLVGIKSEDTILVTEDGPEVLTQTGTWPYVQVEIEGRMYLRPDILVR